MEMEPVRKGDVQLGKPLPYSLYDDRQNLLLRAGNVVQSEHQLEELSTKGLYRKQRPKSDAAARPERDSPKEERGSETTATLEEVKPQIGDPLQLQTVGEQTPQRYGVRLIGFLKGRSVIVSTPIQDGKVLFMREGQSFVVRLFSGRSAYAFPSTVWKVANTPYPHLHLTYPAQLRGVVVRRSGRAKVNLIAAVIDANGRPAAGAIVDISKGGASMSAKTALGEKGAALQVKFRILLDEFEQYITVGAVIRAVSRQAQSEGEPDVIQHGLEFVDVQPSDALALTAFVYQKLLEQMADI